MSKKNRHIPSNPNPAPIPHDHMPPQGEIPMEVPEEYTPEEKVAIIDLGRRFENQIMEYCEKHKVNVRAKVLLMALNYPLRHQDAMINALTEKFNVVKNILAENDQVEVIEPWLAQVPNYKPENERE